MKDGKGKPPGKRVQGPGISGDENAGFSYLSIKFKVNIGKAYKNYFSYV